MAAPTPESDILEARDPALEDQSDEWPEFNLSNALVHLPDHPDAIVSLLEASQNYPVTVVGTLDTPTDERFQLYKGPAYQKRTSMQIENVRFFSYGQYPDGSIALWAPGKAGWFTLQPNRAYKRTYAGMIDAVQTFYYIADAYREPRRSGKGKTMTTLPHYTADEFFEKYAKDPKSSFVTSTDAAEHIYHHKEALLSFMVTGKEDITWSKIPLYIHLIRKFPEVHAEIRQRIKPPTTSSHPATGTDAQNKADETASTTSSSSRSRRERPQRGTHRSLNETLKSENSIEDGLHPATPMKDSDSDSDVPRRKGKSVLRLKPSKAGKTEPRASGKAPVDHSGILDDAQSPSGGKRKHFIEGDLHRPPKRQSSRALSDEGIDIPSSPDNTDSNADSRTSANKMIHDMTYPANDPGQEDTWTCALDGCRYKIYGALKPESQRLIKEHYELHAFDDDERVRLVKRLQEPSLPAGHLMERVKMQAKSEGFPKSSLAGTRYPDSIPIRTGVVQKY
ncbi:uncharacterized protein K489DRAFT_381047 [Dissoconium aciculare CBS 342.82]|jgi:hypothetical protein|uniref:DNA (cytosine-5)-methyltransferase 1 replication foci domain-containing protein n=1 Tax=Dissoconium aciculare CBS 342.82 TaxID=1314786 RepID=A0A6J3M615_9PEZI|nr:uncharacterized protein K489DRAFT_381047 [Dissoconium aciculare CBS 342.82]KAF1822297.1 hypothetical protein K489DRAFT_381047 [Dissoconium aciculare CBS 342.82]